MSQNSLDSTIKRTYQAPNSKYYGDEAVGIELEIEGPELPTDVAGWVVKEEGSLRGGMEYILRQPTVAEEVSVKLDKLEAALAKTTYAKSIRCSTHMHVNVQGLTQRQVYNVLCAYYLIEEVLVRTQPGQRVGNLFCLRMSDAEGILVGILSSIRNKTHFAHFHQQSFKYGACNLSSVQRLSTLEFRFFAPMVTSSEMLPWVLALTNMVRVAKEASPAELIGRYDEWPPKVFLSWLLGGGVSVVPGSWDDEQLNRLMHTNYDSIQEINRALMKSRFQMPEQYWDEDVDSGPGAGGHPFDDPFLTTVSHGEDDWLTAQEAELTASVPGVSPTLSPSLSNLLAEWQQHVSNAPHPVFPWSTPVTEDEDSL